MNPLLDYKGERAESISKGELEDPLVHDCKQPIEGHQYYQSHLVEAPGTESG